MIYFDANATSRLRPAAKAAIAQFLEGEFRWGNPSSVHQAGRYSRAAVRRARLGVLSLLGLNEHSARLVFTSGATEACSIALRGFLPPVPEAAEQEILVSSIEHDAVLENAKAMAQQGYRLKLVPPDMHGRIDASVFAGEVNENSALVALMGAHNETGNVQPVAEMARALRGQGFSGVIFSDLVQAVGKSEVDVGELFTAGVDAVALSGHKLGAPAGVGALVFSKQSCRPFAPLILGGPQEEGLRAGTENLLGIVAFGAVAQEISENGVAERLRLRALRDLLWQRLREQFPDVVCLTVGVGGGEEEILAAGQGVPASLCNTLLLHFPGCRGDDLVAALDLQGIAVSSGAACASGKSQASRVVQEMGYSASVAREVLRVSLDWDADQVQVIDVAQTLSEVVGRVCQ